MKTSVWVEDYRPKSISEVIFQNARQAQFFKDIVSSGNLPNILLQGVQGTGKTTISKALIKDLKIDPSDVLKIDCSDEQISAIREKVRPFASTYPTGKFRVVRLEECDYLSLDAQALLRTIVEGSSSNCRFIGTCNYINKIMPPLRSRFQEIQFKAPDQEQVALRMAEMLEQEKITYLAEDLFEYVNLGYPDIRKIIQLLQQHSTSNRRLQPPINIASKQADWKLELLATLLEGNFRRGRQIVCESATREEHEEIYRLLYENVDKLFPDRTDQEEAIVIIAEYLVNHNVVADTEINLAACFIRLGLLRK